MTAAMTSIFIPPLVFITTALFVIALFPQKQRGLRDRLTPYSSKPGLVGRDRVLAKSATERLVLPLFESLLTKVTALAPVKIREQARLDLERAGQPLSVEAFLAVRAVAMFGLPLLYVLVAFGGQMKPEPLSLAMPLVLFLLGQQLPRRWVRSRIRKRELQIERAMSAAMDLITVSMEAGLAFDAALGKVVEKTQGPLREELDRMLREMTLGKPRREALRDMGKRVALPDMNSFVSAVIQADQMGLGLGNVMRGLADEMRTKRRQRAEEQAMKAPVKMLLPLIFCIFPSMMLVVLGPAVVIIFTKVITTISR